MLDNFREWLSDNLRYILLGLAILVVLVVLFFGAKALFGSGDKDKGSEPKQKTEQEKTYLADPKNQMTLPKMHKIRIQKTRMPYKMPTLK